MRTSDSAERERERDSGRGEGECERDWREMERKKTDEWIRSKCGAAVRCWFGACVCRCFRSWPLQRGVAS